MKSPSIFSSHNATHTHVHHDFILANSSRSNKYWYSSLVALRVTESWNKILTREEERKKKHMQQQSGIHEYKIWNWRPKYSKRNLKVNEIHVYLVLGFEQNQWLKRSTNLFGHELLTENEFQKELGATWQQCKYVFQKTSHRIHYAGQFSSNRESVSSDSSPVAT